MSSTITTAARRIQRDAAASPRESVGYYDGAGVRVGSGLGAARPATWPAGAIVAVPAVAVTTQAEAQLWLDAAAAAVAAGEIPGTGGFTLEVDAYRAAQEA